jgi:predicted ATPase/DNA-binding winged helix-turn-helix (wHTH) protein
MAEHIVRPRQQIAFGRFRLFPSQQLLLEDDRPVPLGSRALDILLALLRQPGELVGKAELLAQVWPSTFVDETNLRVHMAALRKALHDGEAGDRYIQTVPGRGYRFVAPVSSVVDASAPPQQSGAAEPPSNLPLALTRPIGRAGAIVAIAAQIRQRRFVTLVGPGGIGKTTVAVAVARELELENQHGVSFVDLGLIDDPSLVARSLASALGLAVASEDQLPNVLAFLKRKQMLLVFDSCEHVVEAAAATAEDIFKVAPDVQILATSREPLRAVGERVHRLAPLESPFPSASLTAAEALEFPSVQLFVERTAAGLDEFRLTDADAPVVADICRRLDGIALAIELAAGRVAAFGIRELARQLDDRFRLIMSGRRTALPRHQTLAATLEWSYQLLAPVEQTLLRQLAVFAGEFTLEAAVAAAADVKATVADHFAGLVAKSLVVADLRSDRTQYRLLDTTRLFCLEKLRSGGELPHVARRHAEYYRDVFARAEADSDTIPQAEWLAVYAGQIENLRAALDWAFSATGDPGIGVTLTIAAVPLWVELSLIAECRKWVERALATLDSDMAETTMRTRMRLSAALGWSRTFSAGSACETDDPWATTLDLAKQLGDVEYRSRALWGLWLDSLKNGELPRALDLARQFEATVSDSADPIDRLIADRLLATTEHYIGDQEKARFHIERMLRRYVPPGRRSQLVRFQRDQWVTARYFQARIVWLQGFADQAVRIAENAVVEAQSLDHALLLGSALGQAACLIALLNGDMDAAERHAAMLLDHADRHALHHWHQWGRCFSGLVAARRGNIAAGLASTRSALTDAGVSRLLPRYLPLLGEFAQSLGETGEVAAGLALVEESLARCEHSGEQWYVAELLRIKGGLIMASAAHGAIEMAEERYLQALDLARRQGSLAWELRAATSLSLLRRDQGRAGEARHHMAEVLARFSEGFGTSDVRAAHLLAAALT